jgi:methylmalonyl-CoA mutase N-terminal domain/subunit
VRKKRDSQAVARSLKRVDEVARSKDNTMPVLIEAAESQVTLGEICDTLRKAWGTYREAIVF